MRFAEVVDSVESVRDFLNLNKIKQKEIVNIIIVWDEDLNKLKEDLK